MRNLYVVLTRSETALSRIIRIVRGDDYTHAALSLDPHLEYMFSFGRRWTNNPFFGCFKRESVFDALYQPYELPGVVIEIPVSDAQHRVAVALVETFLLNSHLYGYNYLGLAGKLVGCSFQVDKRFFCSEFVYYVLCESGICDFEKPRSLVSPQDLMELKGHVIFSGNLKNYNSNSERDCLRIFQFDSAVCT
jgi:hypothetical protein